MAWAVRRARGARGGSKKVTNLHYPPDCQRTQKERFVKAVGQRVYKNCGIALAVAFGTCLLAINGFRFGLRSGHRCPRENVRSLPFRKRDVSNGTDHREKKLSFGHLKSPTPYVKAAISLNNLVARE